MGAGLSRERGLQACGACVVFAGACALLFFLLLQHTYEPSLDRSYSLLTLLVAFSDGEPTLDREEWSSQTFGSHSLSLASVFANASFGRAAWDPSTSRFLKITIDQALGKEVKDRCSFPVVNAAAAEARRLALAQGEDTTTYDLVEHLFPSMGCGWAGFASSCVSSVGSSLGSGSQCRSFLQGGSFNLYTRVHEIGHTFGLGHASGGGYEYGDPTSVMGGSRIVGASGGFVGFNAAAAVQLGWLPSTDVRSVSRLSPTAVEHLVLRIHGDRGADGVAVVTIDCPRCAATGSLKADGSHLTSTALTGGTVVVSYRPDVLANSSGASILSLSAGVTLQLIKGWTDSDNSTANDELGGNSFHGSELYSILGEGEHAHVQPGGPAVQVCSLGVNHARVAVSRDGQDSERVRQMCGRSGEGRTCDCDVLVAQLGENLVEFRLVKADTSSERPVFRQYHGAALEWDDDLQIWQEIGRAHV